MSMRERLDEMAVNIGSLHNPPEAVVVATNLAYCMKKENCLGCITRSYCKRFLRDVLFPDAARVIWQQFEEIDRLKKELSKLKAERSWNDEDGRAQGDDGDIIKRYKEDEDAE